MYNVQCMIHNVNDKLLLFLPKGQNWFRSYNCSHPTPHTLHPTTEGQKPETAVKQVAQVFFLLAHTAHLHTLTIKAFILNPPKMLQLWTREINCSQEKHKIRTMLSDTKFFPPP